MADTNDFFSNWLPNKLASNPDMVRSINAVYQFDIDGAGQWTVDLTGAPRPANAPHRFLLLRKGDAAFEAGAPLPAAARDLLAEWKRDGVLESEATLAPSASGARSRVSGGKRTWTDGPFTEAKELIGGFAILELPGLAEVKQFTEEYAAILGDNEIDVRVVASD